MLLTQLNPQLPLELVNPWGLLGLHPTRAWLGLAPNATAGKRSFVCFPSFSPIVVLPTRVLGHLDSDLLPSIPYLPSTARPSYPDLISHTHIPSLKEKEEEAAYTLDLSQKAET